MKIISKFKDYYDCGLFYGVDKSVVYVRHTSEPLTTKEISSDSVYLPFHKSVVSSENVNLKFINFISKKFQILMFCGKAYPIIEIDIRKVFNAKDPFKKLNSIHTAYSYQDYIKIITEFMTKKEEGTFLKKLDVDVERDHWNAEKRYIQRYFDQELSSVEKTYEYIHYENGCPVFLLFFDRLITHQRHYNRDLTANFIENPILKDLNFYNVVDPYNAFRDIEMFLGGVMAQAENKMIQIDDEHLAQAKGFDCYSFKKEPSKRKRKSCKCPK